MKINMMKSYGGVFIPADDTEHEKTTKFKNNEMYEIDIKLSRNPKFHGKVFVFFNFCFSYWSDVEIEINRYRQLLRDNGLKPNV